MMIQLAVFLAVVCAWGQCPRDISGILDQLTTNSLQSLNSLHDYVWVLEEHGTQRDRKGTVRTFDWREQTVVASGKMYTRTLQPGEAPALPESEAALLSGYRLAPALQGDCGGLPCGTYPYAFSVAIHLRDLWNVRQMHEGSLQGNRALVIELEPKIMHRSGDRAVSGTAWIDPERCRLLRLVTISAMPNGHNRQEEVLEFDEIKGNWLPVKRAVHNAEKSVEWSQEYTYLRFGSSARVAP